LRNRQLAGAKFRRAAIVEGHVVPFYCPAARLLVEMAGADSAAFADPVALTVCHLPVVTPDTIDASLEILRSALRAAGSITSP